MDNSDFDEILVTRSIGKDKRAPFPEVIYGRGWTLEERSTGGHTSREYLVFGSPMTDTPAARGVKVHELAHVRYSPRRANVSQWGMPPITIMSVEDVRVNMRASLDSPRAKEALEDYDDIKDSPAEETIRSQLEMHQDLRMAICTVLAAEGFGSKKTISKIMYSLGKLGAEATYVAGVACDILRRYGKRCTFNKTLLAARYIEEYLAAKSASLGFKRPEDGLGLEKLINHLHDKKALAYGRGIADALKEKGITPDWGKFLGVDWPIRSRAYRALKRRRKRRFTDEGVLISDPCRDIIDGKVFRTKSHLPSCSVLIDASSSMELTVGELDEIMKLAPGAIIASYSGDGEVGKVRVLAAKGMMVGQNNLINQNMIRNTIDFPALKWLAAQKGPRIWVSDGRVNGYGGGVVDSMILETYELCKKNEISLVENANQAKKLVEFML